MNKELNVVYIGPLSFPLGYASTKRRRYMVDYMNEHGISAHVLCTRHGVNDKFSNPQNGYYGAADYYDLSSYIRHFHFHRYYREGKKKLLQWFDSTKKNVLIFHTMLPIEDAPFFFYARRLGYKIVFDQVETSYIAKGTNTSFKRKCYIYLCECVSNCAYKLANGSFVISSFLWKQNEKRYPQMPLCLLPNSTPVLAKKRKKKLNKPLRILYSGTYAPKDGVNFLIEGIIKAVNKGCDCELILVGKGVSRDMLFLSNISDKTFIKYLGFISDEELVNVMLSCDVLAMTRTNSKFANYGFPFKLSEYLSTGNIVLATRVGDVSFYLKNQENAYLVEPESSNAICDAVINIANHEEEALKIAAHGLETMKQQFSINHVGGMFIQFLNQL